MVLLDTAAMADLHMRWMDLPGPTDVMSFPMDELEPGGRPDAPEPGPAMLGDIVLCPEFAAEQAAAAGHSLGHELALLTIHGVLHLLGYDHAEPDEEKEMFALAAPPARGVGRRPSRSSTVSNASTTETSGCWTNQGISTIEQLRFAARRDRADLSGQRVRGHRRGDQHGVDGAGAGAGSRRAAGCGASGQGDDRSAPVHQPGGAAADRLRDQRDGAAGPVLLPAGQPRLGAVHRRGRHGGDQLRRHRRRSADARPPERLLHCPGVSASAASDFGVAGPDQPSPGGARKHADARSRFPQRAVRLRDRVA